MSIFDLPGLFTVDPPRGKASFFWDQGYCWIWQQVQNGPKRQPYDLGEWSDAKFVCGVWGVTYSADDFRRDGQVLAGIAKDVGAHFLGMDAEYSIFNVNPQPLIDAMSSFPGEKALSTLGAPAGENVYPIDYQAFINAGYHILPQAYGAYALEYMPKHSVEYHKRVGVPLERLHLTVDSSAEYTDPPTGIGHPGSASEIVHWLREADYVSPDISVFMAEYNNDDFYRGLKEITMQQTPKPVQPTNATEAKNAMLQIGHDQEARWERLPRERFNKQRIVLADRLLALSDSEMKGKLSTLQKTLLT